MASNLNAFQFEKYDYAELLHYYSRESIRTLTDYKRQLLSNFNMTRQYEPTSTEDRLIHSSKLSNYEYIYELLEHLLADFEIMNVYKTYLTQMNSDRIKTKLQVRRLFSENKWLNGELFELQNKLIKLENSVVKAEAEKQHFQYLYKMRIVFQDDDKIGHTILMNYDEGSATDPEENVSNNLQTLYNLTIDYLAQKRYEVADALLNENLMQLKEKHGENDEDIGTLYSLLGKTYKSQRLYNEAFDNYSKSLAIREKVHGKETDIVGLTMTNIAHVEYKRNHYKEAEKWAINSLKIREKFQNKSNPDIALIKNRLGQYSIALGKYKDAIANYKQSLSVFETMLDVTDDIIIKTHLDLATSYIKTKQPILARDMILVLTRSYQQKNSNRSDPNVTIFSRLNAEPQLSVEFIMAEFGSYENVLDKQLADIIINYYLLINNKELADKMKTWVEYSVKGPKTIVRQSIIDVNVMKETSSIFNRTSSRIAAKMSSGNGSMWDFFKNKSLKQTTEE